MKDLDVEIRRIVQTIQVLMGRFNAGWISWNQVARHQTGSTDAADVLCALAALPEFSHLFAMNQYKVRLTEQGMELARSLGKEEKSLPEIVAAAVIAYARRLPPIVLDIRDVSVVAHTGKKFVHAIFVDLSDEVLPTETPVQITCLNGRPVTGKLVGQESEGDIVYVACDTDISPAQLPNKLVIDRAYLLTLLADQLRSLPAIPHRMRSIFEPSAQSIIVDPDSTVVGDQLAQLPPPWTHFLWGPPGAGKTFGLGHLVSRLLINRPQETILIVAPSNRAVDVAITHVRNRITVNLIANLIKDRRVLRFGYPRKSEVLSVPELLGPAILDELSARVHQISRETSAAEQEQRNDSDLAMLRARLLAAQEAVKEAVREHVAQCLVVATTTTLAYMPNSPVAARLWDTVIVDEVTMVPPAVCAFLASRCKQHLLFAGDPCQLGPVFEDHGAVADENSALWLKTDVFTMGGVSSGKLTPNAVFHADGRLARISAQRRCATEIWNRIGHLYPQVANAANPSRLRTIAALSPAPGSSVALVDLSNQDTKCEKMKRSWQNSLSARKAIDVAACISRGAPEPFRIAIICPYRAQVKLLRQWIRDERDADNSRFGKAVVEAGTVHQFQGSEADAVVFDIVDGPGRRNLGLLLRGDTGTRLVNVAISRGKGKPVVIADRDWCRKAGVSDDNALLAQLIFGGNSMKVVAPSEIECPKVADMQ